MDMVKVRSPGGQFSWGGEVFVPSKKGLVEVPVEALEDLAPHGIFPADQMDVQVSSD